MCTSCARLRLDMGIRQESGITGRKRLGASGNRTTNQGKHVTLVFSQRDIWIIFI